MSDLIGKARRALNKPVSVVALRIAKSFRSRAERYLGPWRAGRFDQRRLLSACGARSIDELWERLATLPYPAIAHRVDEAAVDPLLVGGSAAIMERAERAVNHTVDLLGSGPVALSEEIDWNTDFKTGVTWPPASIRDIDYMNPDRPSDVKSPWELSRLQWLLPLAQAYQLTGDERYASVAREVINQWIGANPYALSVNWAIAMEASMRAFTLTHLFRVFRATSAWSDPGFRSRFLRSLFLHGDFIERHLERAYINGNHYLSNAAALVWLGHFFGDAPTPTRWAADGWRILQEELPIQVYPDGVNYEASVPYHRFVLELFFYPALMREGRGMTTPGDFREGLVKMARYVQAYSRANGDAPQIGDADDARTLPLGGQTMNDHRYLAGLVGLQWDDEELLSRFSGPVDEIAWVKGVEMARRLTECPSAPTHSAHFPDGGVSILRSGDHYVYIECGPVGLAGYGGHGHNDCLSVELSLAGVPLVRDSGSYVYTASYDWHNRFRSTPFHNTPQIDGEEINRFVDPLMLWSLKDDATPETRLFEVGTDVDRWVGAHSGYRRLGHPVTPVRSVALQKERGWIMVADRFEGEGGHTIRTPFNLDPAVKVAQEDARFLLDIGGRRFEIRWKGDYDATSEEGWHSPSYGVKHVTTRLLFNGCGSLKPLIVVFAPEGEGVKALAWAVTEGER